MTTLYDIFLTDDDIEKIKDGKTVKRLQGGYILHIQKVISNG